MSLFNQLPWRNLRLPQSLRPLALDLVERLLVIGLSGWLLHRLLSAGLEIGHVLLAISEGLSVLFIIIRRPSRQLSHRPGMWLLAFGASTAPLLVFPTSDNWHLVPAGFAALLLVAGVATQVTAKVTLGRSFGMVPAHRGLKLCGPYRLVRHPMYFGYLLAHLGFLLCNPSTWNFTVYAVAYALQISRLLAEERLLACDEQYRQYLGQVRYHLIPGVF